MAYKFNPFTGNLDEVANYAALNLLGTVANAAALPGSATTGDVYQAEDTGIFYVWDGAAWDDLGTLAGPTGADGADGAGVPAGGTTGQMLVKTSNADYDTQWAPATGGGGISDGDKGDITVSGSGTTWTIDAGVVDTTNLGGDITTAGKALLDDADAAAQRTTLGLGDAATKNTGTTAGTVAAGDDSRFATDLTYTANTRVLASSTGTDATLPLFTSTDAGLTPLSGGGTSNFLRADGTWAAPAGGGGGGTPGGSDTQVQFNDGGSTFGGDTGLTFDKTTNTLTVGVDNADPGTAVVKGDINLDDGGTYTTTLQTITPQQNNTISFPDATGTVALVGGSNGQLVYNNAGAYAGASNTSVGASGDITLSANGAASTGTGSAFKLTGDWFVGADPVPQALIQPAGTATSTTWSTSGTGLGVNAASGFNGNLLDLQKDGTSKLRVGSAGSLHLPGDGTTLTSANWTGINGSNLTTTNNGVAIRSNSCFLGSNVLFGWGSTTDPINSQDLSLARDAAHTLAQRNGTNAQTYRLYNTYTDASNYERAKLSWNSNVFEIGTEGAGTGLGRALTLQTSGTDRVTLGAGTGLTVHGSVSQAFIDCTAYFASTTANGSRALAGNGFAVGSAFTYSFSSTTGANGTPDVALKRDQAGVVAVTNGSTGLGTLQAQLRAQGTAPASATATGTAGDIRYDADYIYVCTATNTWKRAALATW